MTRTFRYGIFDLDGLICDTEQLYQRATNLVLVATGTSYQFDEDEYGRILTGRSVATNAEYLRERFGLPAPAKQLEAAIVSLFAVLVADPANLEPMPGLLELLELLKARQVRLAIASGSECPHVEQILHALKLTQSFPVVSCRVDGILTKPAPDIYLRAIARLGADSREAFAIEDSYSGICAARAAGLYAIAVKNDFTRHHDLKVADFVAENLGQVMDHLQGSV